MRKAGFFKAKRLTNGGCTSELFEVIGNRFDNPELLEVKEHE